MVGLLAALVSACTLVPPAPDVWEVTPSWGWSGESTDVEIRGARFLPGLSIDAAEAGSADVDFEAWLEREDRAPIPLENVRFTDVQTLDARVPEGLDAGGWDLRVRTPIGAEGFLEGAFAVTDTRADHLELATATAAYTVGEAARVVVRILDPAGVRVATPALVEVRAASPTGAAGVSFLEDGLDGQVPTGAGVGIRGRLDADGEGAFLVRSDSPDDITLEVLSLTEPQRVEGDSLLLSWNAGRVADVGVELPGAGFEAEAGRAFSVDLVLQDSLGNVLDDQTLDVLLYDTCGELREGRTVRGRSSFAVTLTRACDHDTIRVFAEGREWSSPTFRVRPGALNGYRLDASRARVRAGDGTIGLLVAAVDAWGNVVDGITETLQVADTLGGLDSAAGIGWARCPGFVSGGPSLQLCELSFERTGTTSVRVSDSAGRSGTSRSVLVEPNDPARVELGVDDPDTPRVAGARFDLTIGAWDAWDNAVPLEAAVDPIELRDDTGTLSCTEEESLGDFAQFGCTLTRAGEVLLEADLGTAWGATSLHVDNGVLAEVQLIPAASSVVAGEPLRVRASGWDAFGNPWMVQDEPRVSLTSTRGTLSPAEVWLEADGTGTFDAVLVEAGGVSILANRSGAVIGASPAFTVAPAGAEAIVVNAPAWVERGAEAIVSVDVVDVYGNATGEGEGPLTVAGELGGCGTGVGAMLSGHAELSLPCVRATLEETLLARFDAWEASSGPMDVVDLDCPDGPLAELLVEGVADAVVCGSPSGARVSANATGSGAGDAAIVRTWMALGEEGLWRLASEGASELEIEGVGVYEVQAVVVDAEACGARASAHAWVGTDDGSATGPVSVSAPAIGADGDVLEVRLAATDCGGAPATLPIGVRASIGTLAATSTGGGLEVVPDARGEATLRWTIADAHGGLAEVSVGGPVAWGTASVAIAGDRTRPRVAWLSGQSGTGGELVGVEIGFTEPMLASSLRVSLESAGGAVPLAMAWSADRRQLSVIVLDPLAVTPPWTLTIDASAEDLAGNGLDGWGDGSSESFSTRQGAGTVADAPSACTVDAARFTPDGDDGPGRERDAIAFAWGSATDPEAWVWRVYADDEVRASGRIAGSTRTWPWDGRGEDGRVAPAGAYRWELRALDADGVEGMPCTLDVTLLEAFSAP